MLPMISCSASALCRWSGMPVARWFGHQHHLLLQQAHRHGPVYALVACAAQQSSTSADHRPLPRHLIPIPVARRSASSPAAAPTSTTASVGTRGLPRRSSRRLVLVRDKICLTELEEKIFNTLKDVVVHFRLNTQLRVAGGWVRDKLLGEESGDIDIALDDMLGKSFCQKLVWYLRRTGFEVNGFGVIKSNPMQAKHLEVARMQIFGVFIDFVNLRPEHYTDLSSFPAMQDFGTAREDAFRRDLTINSLFYNINTGMVEDPTGKGLPDLRAGILATPLPAKRTFMDDPLRILRAIRFVATLDYELHQDIKAAVDKDIRLSLSSKISRERIGGEVDRIFRSDWPIKGLEQLVDLDLFSIIFSPPLELGVDFPDGVDRLCLRGLEVVWEVLNLFGSTKLTKEDRKTCLLAAFLFPLRTLQFQQNNRMVPISFAIIKESLKMRTVDATKVVTLHQMAENFSVIRNNILELDLRMQKCRDHFLENGIEPESFSLFSKHQAELLLRDTKGLWRPALLLSSVLEEPIITNQMTPERRSMEFVRRSNLCALVEEAILRLGGEQGDALGR